jgi:glycosyltransferase involved in cell wall biosynthesis
VCRSNGLEHLNYQRMLDDSRAGLTAKPWTRRLWYPASRLWQVAGAARAADRLLVLNEVDRDFAAARGWQPPDRIDVVPHGVSEMFLVDVPRDLERGAGALFCGAWDRVKGTTYLVGALDALAAEGRPVPLTVLGPGVPAAQVRASFSERARPFVTVIDRVPEERVMMELRRHDLLLFPSTYEGFGLVVLEAMSQGLPVVATPVGCAASLVRDGRTGVIVPCRDARALSGAVARLMDSRPERRRLGDAAAAAVSHMSWRNTADLTVAVYRRAIAQAAS